MGLPSSEIRVPARPPAVTTSWRGVRLRSAMRAPRRDIGRLARSPEATNRSERTTRNAATTNSQSSSRKPALVSCNTSSGTLWLSLGTEDEPGLPHPYHVAVDELPGLDRGAIDCRAVGRSEVGEHRGLTVPRDLRVAPGHAGVGQPELGVLATTHHRGALGQLVLAIRTVVEGERRRQPGITHLVCRRIDTVTRLAAVILTGALVVSLVTPLVAVL